MRGVTETVKHLLIINGIFFFAANILGDFFIEQMALHFYLNPTFQIWQPITHMFMHANVSHIFFNMFGLWMFGSPLEQLWGKKKFLFYYFSAGLGAAIIQLLAYAYQFHSVTAVLNEAGFATQEIINSIAVDRIGEGWLEYVSREDVIGAYGSYFASMVGASGALYGILVAFAFMFPNVPLFLIFVPIPIKAKYFVPILILGDLFFGFSSYSIGPIAHFAHVGGAVTGFLMMYYWKKNQFNQNRWN
ncbi:MAG: rhomboid family intramembrane serine protease [Flavobacteriaceae bacterium]|jgi:membrane associated rhomboid family serine protease|nr:rhomboid family intramembrane serine protease [Flavobacteriaceae bacterium]